MFAVFVIILRHLLMATAGDRVPSLCSVYSSMAVLMFPKGSF